MSVFRSFMRWLIGAIIGTQAAMPHVMQPPSGGHRRNRSARYSSKRHNGELQGLRMRPRWGRKLNGVI